MDDCTLPTRPAGAMICQDVIFRALSSIGLDGDRLARIASGGEIYGEYGLLDSVHLVALIAALEECWEGELKMPVDLSTHADAEFLDHFRNLTTLIMYFEDRWRDERSAAAGVVDVG